MLILLVGMDLEFMFKAAQNNSLSEHHILVSSEFKVNLL